MLELCGRTVARRSLLHAMSGTTPPMWLLVFVGAAICGLLMGHAATHPRRATAALFAALFMIGVALQIDMGARLQSDGFYYFAYLRSLAFDGDVDFANDYRLLGLGDKANLFQLTKTGHAQSAWTIGPAIVWSPFFGAAHLVARRLNQAHPEVSANGISFPYRQAVCVANLLYGLLGCWFCYRLTARFFGPALSAAAVALTITGSFVLWYLVKEPSMTHAPSMAGVAGFVWMWAATRDRRSGLQWALLGALAGFIALIRWQNAIFAVLPGWDAVALGITALRLNDGAAFRRAALSSALFAACATLAFLPQMLAWRSIYGTWFAISPVGPQIRWTDPHIADVLWSARNGLFSTAPILYVGGIGLVLFAFARPATGVPALLAVILMTYFNACIQDWWGSAGFGGRRFDGAIPFFCLGVAAAGQYSVDAVRRHAFAAAVGAGALLALWNLTLMGASQSGALRIGETVAFDRAWAAQAHVFHGWFGNPFSYPASLIFAARNRVGPSDYDLLSTDRFIGDPLRPYARVDIGGGDEWLIQEGWHDPEREGPVTFRWASSPAVIRIPLDHAATLRVQVRLHAFAYPGAPPQTLTIAAGSGSCDSLPVSNDWQTAECTLSRENWSSGVNRLTFRFGYQRRPAEVGLGGDDRLLAAAVDFVRISVP